MSRTFRVVLALGFPTLAAGAFAVAPDAGPLSTPYAQRGSLKIGVPSLSSATVPRYERLEVTVPLAATYDNPFDSADIRLDARVTPPGGLPESVPGFLYQPYTRRLEGGREVLTPAGEPSWRVRYTPSRTGPYSLQITVRDRTGSATVRPLRFTCTAGKSPGFVRVSRTDPRYFAFDGGQPYFPIGANICWAGGRGTYDYDDWLPAYATAGCNYGRLWLSPHWTTNALERPGKPTEGRGLGVFDLGNAWRLDYILDQAAARGMYLMLCIDSYNILRDRDASPSWEDSPHNAAMGGPLRKPTEFWTNETVAARYRDKLRYLVARYGASPHVLAWEFWNEVDLTRDYASAPVARWHQEMSAALRELDPYRHLLTTSFSRREGDPAVDRLPGLDYVQTHHYGEDLVKTVMEESARKLVYSKPHFVGEIGANAGGADSRMDPRGYQIHDPLWASLVAGAAGGAMPWWWDNYIGSRKLYGIFTPAARFVAGVNWPAERFRSITPRVRWRDEASARAGRTHRTDLAFESGPTTWSASEYNRPRTVRVTRAGAAGALPLAGIQHGLTNHPDLHNPVTFQTDLPWPTRLEVEVGDVSGYGGAALRITVDGREALSRDFADTDSGTRTLSQYAGRYGVDLPAGKHTVNVENPGKDWFTGSFRLRGAVEPSGPPLTAYALAGNNTVLTWAQVEGRTWRRVARLRETIPPAPPSLLELPDLPPGGWTAEVWDTWSGRVLSRAAVGVGRDRIARLSLPEVATDIAVKLRRQSTGGKG